MPSSITVIGMLSAVIMVAKPLGNPVNNRTITRMSHTWLASQMGAMASAMASRCSLARGPNASKSHIPPPKSAPPISAYTMSDSKMKMAMMTSSIGCPRWLVWHSIGRLQELATQQKHNNDCQKDVNHGENDERHDHPAHWCHSFMGSHHTIHYPRLASHFRHDPAGFNRQKPQRPGRNKSTQKQ